MMKRKRKLGVTLIELLTVLAVVSLLALLVLPSVKSLMTDRKGTQSAVVLRNFLEAARARAVGSGLPVAVVFERMCSVPADINSDGLISDLDLQPLPLVASSRLISATATDPLDVGSTFRSNFLVYNACVRLSMAEQPLPVTSVMLPATLISQLPSSGGFDIFSVQGGATNDILLKYFVNGNQVSFEQSNTRFLINAANPVAGDLRFSTLSSNNLSPTLEEAIPSTNPVLTVPTTFYTIYPKPRPINGPSAQLPKGTCIDLSLSGFSSQGNLAGRDKRMRFSSAWLYATASAPTASEVRPIYVVFTPDGGMSRVYANGVGTGTLVPVDTADDFFFHVGKTDQVVVPSMSLAVRQNLTDPSSYVVRLSPKSGAISTAPARQGLVSATATLGDVIELTRQSTYGAPLTGQ